MLPLPTCWPLSLVSVWVGPVCLLQIQELLLHLLEEGRALQLWPVLPCPLRDHCGATSQDAQDAQDAQARAASWLPSPCSALGFLRTRSVAQLTCWRDAKDGDRPYPTAGVETLRCLNIFFIVHGFPVFSEKKKRWEHLLWSERHPSPAVGI